jgi:hypothetical protein
MRFSFLQVIEVIVVTQVNLHHLLIGYLVPLEVIEVM